MRPHGALGGLVAVEAISPLRVALVANLPGLMALDNHVSPGLDSTPLRLEDAARLISVSTAFLARQVGAGALHVAGNDPHQRVKRSELLRWHAALLYGQQTALSRFGRGLDSELETARR